MNKRTDLENEFVVAKKVIPQFSAFGGMKTTKHVSLL